MKHFAILLILAIMPTLVMGQQKLIESQIKPNRRIGEAIRVTNDIQVLSFEQIKRYCNQHDLILGNCTFCHLGVIKKTVSAFFILPQNEKEAYFKRQIERRTKGQFFTIANSEQILTKNDYINHGFFVVEIAGGDKFQVLPKDEVDLYIYNEKIGEPQKWAYSRLSQTGTAETFEFGKLDFKWSGNVTDGKINGTGCGFAKISDKQYCYVHAEFVNGLPKGEVKFVKYGFNYNPTSGYTSDYKYIFSDWSEGIAYVKTPYATKWGLANAEGKIVVKNKFYDVVEPFKDGHGVVMMHYGTTDSETTCPDCSGRGTISGCSNCGGDGYTGWSNDTRCSTCNGTGSHRCSNCNGKGKVHAPGTPIIKDIVIDKDGEFVDWGPIEKERLAEQENAEKARQQRIKDSIARVEQLRIEAERKKAELERKVAINCNPKLWSKGDHICYSLPNYSGKITCGTLEEWNENHTKAKIKVVTSPSKNATYNGEQLYKYNTFWIDTKGTKWHKAVDGELETSLEYDNSIKNAEVIYQGGSNNDCTYCNGAGKRKCTNCNGTGKVHKRDLIWGLFGSDFNSYESDCESCYGTGAVKCTSCYGTGKKVK